MFANKFPRYPNCPCGLVVIVKKDETEIVKPVPLKSTKVDFTILDCYAEVRVTQVYCNAEAVPIEAEYLFPLDDKAAVFEFEADIDGRKVHGQVKEREQANADYQHAIQQGFTAALLEKKKPDIFKAKIGNLGPGVKAIVTISYLAELLVDGENQRFILPTTIAPRYVPRSSSDKADELEIGAIEFTKYSPCQLLIRGKVLARTEIVEIVSPTHKLDVTKGVAGSHSATLELSGLTTDMDRDLIVLVKVAEPHQPRVFVEVDDANNSVAAMVTLVPSFKLKDEKAEIVFIIDRSGSMLGEKVEMAKNALKLFLKSLPTDCYFNIVGFGSAYAALFTEGSAKYDGESLQAAMHYADTLHANMGGTEILQPLQFVYEQAVKDGYKRQVIVLTDGEVSNVEAVLKLAQKNNKKSRTFSLGIGSDVSHGLVRGIARHGLGTSAFCSLDERLETKVQQQLANCFQPALENVRISWGKLCSNEKVPATETEEKRTLLGFGKPKKDKGDSEDGVVDEVSSFVAAPWIVPQIFDGSRFTQLCMFPKSLLGEKQDFSSVLGPVVIHADAPDGPLTVELPVDGEGVTKGNTIHRLAVKMRIQDLEEGTSELHENLDEMQDWERRQAVEKKVKEALVSLSTKYGILSRETAFIAVDSTKSSTTDGAITMETRKVPSQMPYGYGGGGMIGGAIPQYAMFCANSMPMCAPPPPVGGMMLKRVARCAKSTDVLARGSVMAFESGPLPCSGPPPFPLGAPFAGVRYDSVVPQQFEDESLGFGGVPSQPEGIQKPGVPLVWDDESKLRALVDLQLFDGCFDVTEKLAEVLKTDEANIRKGASDNKLDADVIIWATALAVAFMQLELIELQDDWQLMFNKAKQGIQLRLEAAKASITLEDVLKLAAEYVQKIRNN